ncbi:unnamed protein product [Allacma fusca]|uniref:TIR domain-containing protein n=1 Tax=Allacma fusca TaxID=39272 RepID=A0A8J2KV87_9HEXA|nr:unnamed protein product [Allacma fusca]
MNDGVKLLGATISIICFLRLCGVLGEETDSRAPEIYADYFANHNVDDVVKGWLLHEDYLATRKLIAKIWHLETNSRSEKNISNSSMNMFFESSAKTRVIRDTVYDNFHSKVSIKGLNRKPACHVLQESLKRNFSQTESSRNFTLDVDLGGCRFINPNKSLICDSLVHMRNLPQISHKLELLQLNATNITYLDSNAFGPMDVITINIVGNKINCIHPYAFAGVNVKILYFESNLIDYIRPDDFPTLTNTTAIFMEHNNISLVEAPWGVSSYPGNCSTVLPSLTFLSLIGNPLIKIPSDYFCALRESPVTDLDLTNCNLQLVEAGALSFFPKLRTLKLGENPMLMEKLDAVLAQVKDVPLKQLQLESNSLSKIPTNALQYFWTSLKTLDLGGNLFDIIAPDSFPTGSSELTELNLENCRIRFIHQDAFRNMAKLRNLNLSSNRLSSIPSAITHLPQLSLLHMSTQVRPKASIISVGNTVYSFQFQPDVFINSKALKMLDLQHLYDYQVIIRRDTFKHLENLEYLLLADSSIETIAPYAFEKLSKLKRLDLSYNKITSIQDVTFYGLQSLVGLYLDHNLLEIPCPSTVAPQDKFNLTEVASFLDSEYFKSIPRDDTGAPKAVPTSGVEPFRYMPKLEDLKITNNRIRFVNSMLFQWLPNLRTAELCGNLFKTWTEKLFLNGSFVTNLTAARNNIGYLSGAMLEDLVEITSRSNSRLDISENPLVCFDTTCTLVDKVNDKSIRLEYWDSDNKYMCWDMRENDYYSLRNLRTSHETACSSISPDWRITTMSTSIPINGTNAITTATTPATETTEPQVEEKDLPNSQNGNSGSPMLTFAIVFTSLCFVPALVIIGYKKRFHLKYFWFVVKFNVVHSPNLNLIGVKKNGSTPSNYDFDIFVSYNHSDRGFIENYLVPHLEGYSGNDEETANENSMPFKICIHERDFKAGVPITENIVDFVDRSRKVVVIVSKSYLESQWCLYEMNLAYHRLIESYRKDFVVVLLEDIPSSLRTKSLNFLLLSRTYLEWPGVTSSLSEQNTFWKRIRNSLSDLD